jgi:transcriptional regulator with XRE-family HTH domain/quercetin dioxygenase-like cupin family protein
VSSPRQRTDAERAPREANIDVVFVGDRLREERLRQGMGVRELARRVGVSPSLISQIDHGRVMPSVGTLYAIVSALSVSLDELFDVAPSGGEPRVVAGQNDAGYSADGSGPDASRDASPGQDGAVVRRAQRHKLQLGSGVLWERLTAANDPNIDFLHVVYEVGGASSEAPNLIRHNGKEYGLVLSGRLGVTIGFETYELNPGDSISFESSLPHRLWNEGDQPAEAIWIVHGRGSDPRRPSG